jgi:indoleamine 2,3-dioxygenase
MLALSDYDLDPERGFLPARDPLQGLPPAFIPWETMGARVPGLLIAGRVRRVLDRLPELNPAGLRGIEQQRRAFLLLTVLANAYIMGERPQAKRLPRNIAVPLAAVARALGLPPVFTYASLILYNWARIDPKEPVELGNIATLRGYHGGMDESWFFLSMAAIEARGAPAVPAMVAALRAMEQVDEPGLTTQLGIIAETVQGMIRVLHQVPDKCDPYVFYRRVRPILDAWEAPGVIYEGVHEEPVMLTAASAAQCALIQALDLCLGIPHEGPGGAFLRGMRDYMPAGHRRFLADLEAAGGVHGFVGGRAEAALTEAYNACVAGLDAFRKKHHELTVRYVVGQAKQQGDAVSYGTSGTELSQFLGKVRKETGARLIRETARAEVET